MDVIDLFGAGELVQIVGQLFGENAGDVRVALKTVFLDQGENAFHFALIVNVFGEDVFVERIASGAVNEEVAVFAEAARPFGEKLPAPFAGWRDLAGVFELIAGPEDGTLGRWIEAIRIEHGALIVIAEQDDLALHHEIDALARVGAVADHVAEAVDFGNSLFFNILEDGLQRLKVAVDIANDRLHAWLSGCSSAAPGGPLPLTA